MLFTEKICLSILLVWFPVRSDFPPSSLYSFLSVPDLNQRRTPGSRSLLLVIFTTPATSSWSHFFMFFCVYRQERALAAHACPV
jgi:hypothetical protein